MRYLRFFVIRLSWVLELNLSPNLTAGIDGRMEIKIKKSVQKVHLLSSCNNH